MRTQVVVDSSIALRWVLEEAFSVEAANLLEQWQAAKLQVVAPVLLEYEVANVLYRRSLRGDFDLTTAQQLLCDLLALGPRLIEAPGLSAKALDIAARFSLPAAYDSQYLALAETLGCEFWTADERLWNAARTEMSTVRWVGELKKDVQ